MRNVRKNSNPYKILRTLALGAGILTISMISPLGGSIMARGLIKAYIRRKNFERQRFLNDLKNLQTRNLIDYQELEDGNIKLTLTKAGKKKNLTYQIDSMTLRKSKHWDGKWRLIIFDIPHSYKRARDVFRNKLKDLKFYPLQKSVFITPYPCEDEIDFLASFFNVRNFLLIMEISRFEGEEKLKNYFKI